MQITDQLVKLMNANQVGRVCLFSNLQPFASIEEASSGRSSSFDTTYRYKFSLSWESESICTINQTDEIKQDMVRHLKHDVYGSVIDELYRILKESYDLPISDNKISKMIVDLITELRR